MATLSTNVKDEFRMIVSMNDSHFTALWILSGTIRVSRYQKGKTKTNLDFLKKETVSGSGISWAICKSAPRPRQITTPVPHHSVFYRPDALKALAQKSFPIDNKAEIKITSRVCFVIYV